MALPTAKIRHQFPILQRRIDGHPLAYLDNAATTQKPNYVLEAMNAYYRTQNANAHRGMHVLAEETTEAYEAARRVVQRFLHVCHPEEIVFTKSCTEAINIVAGSLYSPPSPAAAGEGTGERGSVILSKLEHHSNIIPWMQQRARLHWIDIHDDGELRYDHLDRILAKNTIDIVAITGQSNVLGVQPNLATIVAKAHSVGARVLIDAAQLVAHHPIDVQKLDCDFLVFSGHKLYGPTGIGVLYGKRELLQEMPPMLGGGGMVQNVTEETFIPLDPPARFEAGTPPVAEAVGLAAAIDWLSQFSWEDIVEHEQNLLLHAREVLQTIDGIHILGPGTWDLGPGNKNMKPHPRSPVLSPQPLNISGCLSFTLDGVHPHDLTDILGKEGICLRAGHHCAQPLHRRLGVTASTRLSVALYNTFEEIDCLPAAIDRAKKLLQGSLTARPLTAKS